MAFEAEFKAHLSGASSVTDLINSKIFPLLLPEEVALPAVVYTIVNGDPQNSLQGFDSGLVRYDVQVDCWATKYARVIELALAVRDRLNVDASTFRTVIDQYPLLDDYEEETKRFRRCIGVSCWHRE